MKAACSVAHGLPTRAVAIRLNPKEEDNMNVYQISPIPRPAPKRHVAVTLLSIVLATAYMHSATAASLQTADGITCRLAQGETVTIATAKLIIKYNSTDDDLGVHGAFDDHGWSELCVYDPNGRRWPGYSSNRGNRPARSSPLKTSTRNSLRVNTMSAAGPEHLPLGIFGIVLEDRPRRLAREEEYPARKRRQQDL